MSGGKVTMVVLLVLAVCTAVFLIGQLVRDRRRRADASKAQHLYEPLAKPGEQGTGAASALADCCVRASAAAAAATASLCCTAAASLSEANQEEEAPAAVDLTPVGQWLHEIGLSRYAPAFAEQGVGIDMLPTLSDSYLESELRITSKQDRKTIMHKIGEERKKRIAGLRHEGRS